jgi:oligogalacturonide transport system substrate-binding protein
MTKRLITSVATVALTLALGGVAMAQDKTIRFAWWGGDDRHEPTLKVIQMFEAKNPGIKVKAEYAGWTGYQERLTTQFAGGAEPDIMQINWAWLALFSKNGDGFYDLNKVKDKLNLGDFPKATLDDMTVKGKLNAMPMGFTARVFIYNKEPWKKAGIAYPKSWDELYAAGKGLAEKIGPDAYPLDASRQDGVYLAQMWAIQKLGKGFIKTEEPELAMSKAELVETIDYYKTMVKNRAFQPLPARIAQGGAEQALEQFPAWVNGLWAGNYTWDSSAERRGLTLPGKVDQLEVGPMILIDGAKTSGTIGRASMAFAVSKRTKYPDEAAKFLAFLLTDKDAAKVLGMTRGVPASNTAWATVKEQVTISPLLMDALKQIEDLRGKSMIPEASPYFEHPRILNVFYTVFEKVAYGRVTSEQAADEIIAECTKLLPRLN